jgi:hypothetical protein
MSPCHVVIMHLIFICIFLAIKFANSPPCAWRGSSGQKPQYDLKTLTYQRFTAVLLLLIYGSLFLSGVYYCLSVLWYSVMKEH